MSLTMYNEMLRRAQHDNDKKHYSTVTLLNCYINLFFFT